MPLLRGVLALAWLSIVVLFAMPAKAFVPPAITGHVTDTAHKLGEAERLALDKKLEDYRRCSTNEVAVLIAESLQGGNIEDAAHATFNTWKVGTADADNGVLLVIAPVERQIRIETGKGVGGQLTDLESFHIIRDTIKPQLKADRTFAAVDEGTTAIGAALGGCAMAPADVGALGPTTPKRAAPPAPLPPPPRDAAKAKEPASEVFPMLAVVVGFVVVIGVIFYGAFRDLTLMVAFPFAFVGSTFLTMIAGAVTNSATVGAVTAIVSFLGIGLPLWWWARKRNGGPRRPARGAGGSWGGGSGGESTSSWGSASSSSSSSYGSSSSSGGGYGGSGYTGGGGSSGGGGASDSY